MRTKSNQSKANFLFLSLFLFAGCQNGDEEVPKPNILWVTIEDTSPQFIGCYGDDNASTPVIDQLAEEKMKNFCADKNLDISLMAINYLLYSENKEPFIETIRTVHEMEDRDYNVQAACMDFLGSLGLVPNNPEYTS